MSKIVIYSCIYLVGVIISAFAQTLLKKSAMVDRKNKIKEYLNAQTIIAYTIFFSATLCSVFAYKYVPLSMGPILGTSEYIFITVLSYIFLKEKVNKKKLMGLLIIICGILIYSI